MARKIGSIAVLGAGTMGSGIAGACANAGDRVLLLDVSREAAAKALERIRGAKPPMLSDPSKIDNIRIGDLSEDLGRIADYDWICEAVIEDLSTKRTLFERVEPLRRQGSVVSTNTSGIPLKAITEGMPDSLRRDIVVTHFFNPVSVMRLMELVPGEDTAPEVLDALADYCRTTLGKGVVHAKDTVNFIGNRIGCFWMLSGLHKAEAALADGLDMETIDQLMSKPVGLPPTGLYGLIDLIGLDVMELVGKNLAANLPADDVGRAYTRFPEKVQAMAERGQLGRKTGAGFYRVTKSDDGSRLRHVFDLTTEAWRPARDVNLDAAHQSAEALLFADDTAGRFAWDLMGGTLVYAADLVPEIADDIVNIDRAMRWGFNWRRGPFEMLDDLGPARVMERLEGEGRPLPAMLAVLKDAGAGTFYSEDGKTFIGRDGSRQEVPPE